MKLLNVMLIFLAPWKGANGPEAGANSPDADSGGPLIQREKRFLPQFESMIWAMIAKSGTYFIGHGNWCGYGGSGSVVDPLDECCKVHDLCYNGVKNSCGWSRNDLYSRPYRYTLFWGSIYCHGNQRDCTTRLCNCDRTAAYCFRKNQRFRASDIARKAAEAARKAKEAARKAAAAVKSAFRRVARWR